MLMLRMMIVLLIFFNDKKVEEDDDIQIEKVLKGQKDSDNNDDSV